MPRTVIGIPCFNEEQFITGTLISALQQFDDASDLEIHISDNCSTDETLQRIESVIQALPKYAGKVHLQRQVSTTNVEANFWSVFDTTDSEFFLWLGAHDQISSQYICRGVDHLVANPTTSMFCGTHKALDTSGNATLNPINYDFSQDNPVERYLRSIQELNNCYIFHSIFRRSALDTYERPPTSSSDHILISRCLWMGQLEQSHDCFYIRRYFNAGKRKENTANEHYVHGKNNVGFYEAYLSDLDILASSMPNHVKAATVREASDLLIRRFGLPYLGALTD